MIPEWETIDQGIKRGFKKEDLTALERFIYENEPQDGPWTRKFRTGLEAVIAEVQAQQRLAPGCV